MSLGRSKYFVKQFSWMNIILIYGFAVLASCSSHRRLASLEGPLPTPAPPVFPEAIALKANSWSKIYGDSYCRSANELMNDPKVWESESRIFDQTCKKASNGIIKFQGFQGYPKFDQQILNYYAAGKLRFRILEIYKERGLISENDYFREKSALLRVGTTMDLKKAFNDSQVPVPEAQQYLSGWKKYSDQLVNSFLGT